MPSTIAILSVSAGAGHVRAAQALVAAAERRHPGARAVHIDVMDHVSRLFRKYYAESFLTVVEKSPELWSFIYQKTDKVESQNMLPRFRRTVERLSTRRLREALRALKPDHVICTHFLPAELMSRMIDKGAWSGPVWVVVTDFDLHGLWVQRGIRGYFAASEEVAWRMAARGIPGDRAHVTGIPIMPEFGEALDRAAYRSELGMDRRAKAVLLMGGGAGVGRLHKMAEHLLALEGDCQVVALAGRNEALLADLRAVAARHPGRLIPMGFTRQIERVMAACDVGVSKPGGLTSSECLAMSLPLILMSVIPGQEERNANYLLENGAALRAFDEAGLAYRVRELLGNPARLELMRENARRLARPDAAYQILEQVLAE